MLLKKTMCKFLILTRTTILEKNTVQHLHLDSTSHNFFKIVKKAAGYSNSVLSHSAVKNLLQNCKSVNEQIDAFLSYVQLSEQDVSNRLLICKDIENALRTTFPESSVHPVGSSVSGLGLRGCDLDLSFHYCGPNTAVQNVVVTNVDVSSGKVPVSDFFHLPLKQQLIFIQKLLKESGIITDASTVLPGKFPILNFRYNGLGCDLSINNRAALYGTHLMQLCNKLDHRVAPLFQLITYWGKHFKFIGGPLKFKSYAIFLMIVYFLQQRHPSILPEIERILPKIADLDKNIRNLSSEANENIDEFKSSNSEDLETLLREIFFFYANFDFTSVICTFDKSLWDAKTFLEKEPVFELNTINVQDPFNLSWNVTTGVDWKHSKFLIKSLLSACEAYHQTSDQPIVDQNWGLLPIFDQSALDYSFARKETVEIKIPLDNVDEKSESLRKICDNVFSVLEDCLLFQCHPVDSKFIRSYIGKTATNNKAIAYHKKYDKFKTNDENETTTAIDSGNVLFSRSMYVVVSETWRGRSNFYQNDVKNEQSFRSVERQISNQVLERKLEEEDEKFIFLCECSVLSVENNDVFLNVVMRSANRPVFIPKLRIFLKEYITKYSRFL